MTLSTVQLLFVLRIAKISVKISRYRYLIIIVTTFLLMFPVFCPKVNACKFKMNYYRVEKQGVTVNTGVQKIVQIFRNLMIQNYDDVIN